MVPRCVLLLGVLAVLPTAACGQNANSPDEPITRADFDELKQIAEENKVALADLSVSIDRLSDVLSSGPSGIRFRQSGIDPSMDASVGAMEDSQLDSDPDESIESASETDSRDTSAAGSDIWRRLRRLEREVRALRNEQYDHGIKLGQIARVGSNGRYYPFTNANNSIAKNHFRGAVKATAPELGTVVIRNRMPHPQYVRVNRGRWEQIHPGRQLEFPVERGAVSTQLWGQDPNYWTIGAPDYYQSLDIHERS
jgi:hypothetical protein